jgi:aconitate hydratase
MEQRIASLQKLQDEGRNIAGLPFSIRILLENVLRNHDNFAVTDEHLDTLVNWDPAGIDHEIPFKPARVLMQDFTGVPAVVDLASIRAEVIRRGKDGSRINPAIPVDLVIDHSVQVDYFGTDYAYNKNVVYEYERNKERYQLLKWAQQAFDNFTVVPPGMGICHQVNLEYLAKGVISRDGWTFPDSLVGTDSHTPMINGIGVLGWGVGGIEAEAALLGQPVYFTCPQVIGLELKGQLPEGVTATDMVLTITELLRKYGVVGKFVEVFGDGLDHLSVPDRATISNMSPEFGCTATYFPIDNQTLEYMRATNRSAEQIQLVEDYCKGNMLWRTGNETIRYTDIIQLDLSLVQPTLAGPKRPQDKILVKEIHEKFGELLDKEYKRIYTPEGKRRDHAWLSEGGSGTTFSFEVQKSIDEVAVEMDSLKSVRIRLKNQEYVLSDGSITIAAITSCTNTSNPAVMIGAGLVAKKAISRGLDTKPWVKTSLAPGSRVVTQYLERAGLSGYLAALRFHTVGYGCTSCIGNSGPLPAHISEAVDKGKLIVASVLSGNRNFEARVHPQVKMNFLTSPLLVVAYALAGRIDINLVTDPLGYDPNGDPVFLRDIWPTQKEINEAMNQALKREDFDEVYKVIFDGDEQWQGLHAPDGKDYHWSKDSTYIKEASFFKDLPEQPAALQDISNARVLLKLGDSVTTDHISPAGSFKSDSPAGKYLLDQAIDPRLFNSYGSRRGNEEVMTRGTFANVRIKNQLSSKEGGFTTLIPAGTVLPVYDAAMQYATARVPLIILAGKEYGSGSSRDWAAKGTNLLGVKAVITESYERIHRSNLVGMGVIPLEYINGENADKLGLTGFELFSIVGIGEGLVPGKLLSVVAKKDDGAEIRFEVKSRLDSAIEIEYYRNGGILHYVVRDFLAKS